MKDLIRALIKIVCIECLIVFFIIIPPIYANNENTITKDIQVEGN